MSTSIMTEPWANLRWTGDTYSGHRFPWSEPFARLDWRGKCLGAAVVLGWGDTAGLVAAIWAPRSCTTLYYAVGHVRGLSASESGACRSGPVDLKSWWLLGADSRLERQFRDPTAMLHLLEPGRAPFFRGERKLWRREWSTIKAFAVLPFVPRAPVKPTGEDGYRIVAQIDDGPSRTMAFHHGTYEQARTVANALEDCFGRQAQALAKDPLGLRKRGARGWNGSADF